MRGLEASVSRSVGHSVSGPVMGLRGRVCLCDFSLCDRKGGSGELGYTVNVTRE